MVHSSKYRLLVVEVVSALICEEVVSALIYNKEHDLGVSSTPYVKVCTHKKNQLQAKTKFICPWLEYGYKFVWDQKFVFAIPPASNGENSSNGRVLQFEIFTTNSDGKSHSDENIVSLVGVAECRLDELRPSKEEYSISFEIWNKVGLEVGILTLKIQLLGESNASILGDIEWENFGMKYEDFMMVKTNTSSSIGKTIGPFMMCFAPRTQD